MWHSWVLCSGFRKAAIRCQCQEMESHLRLQVLFQPYLVAGKILLAVIELMMAASRPAGEPYTLKSFIWFRSTQVISLLINSKSTDGQNPLTFAISMQPHHRSDTRHIHRSCPPSKGGIIQGHWVVILKFCVPHPPKICVSDCAPDILYRFCVWPTLASFSSLPLHFSSSIYDLLSAMHFSSAFVLIDPFLSHGNSILHIKVPPL